MKDNKMKAYIIQPRYSMNGDEIDACFLELLDLLDRCDKNADIIVLPEYCDVLANVKGEEDFIRAMEKNGPIIEKKARETAKRCNAIVFVNYGCKTDKGFRNTTHVIDRDGKEIGRYYKQHPAPSELKNNGIDTDYSNAQQDIYTIEIEGIKFGFRTCYDF